MNIYQHTFDSINLFSHGKEMKSKIECLSM